MILFYDTETTGLPKDYKAHVHDVDNWPRLVQLAWIVVNTDGDVLTSRNHIIKVAGISPEAAAVHGITDEISQERGIDILRALVEFRVAAEICGRQVGHNVNFDRKIMGAEFIRYGMEETYQRMKTDMDKTCTMMKSTKFCNIPHANGRGTKWPKLQELHTILFGENFDEAHDAMADIEATMKCYWELIERGVINE